ncbi:MAG: hypothetical protein WCK88_00085 [bacterium]
MKVSRDEIEAHIKKEKKDLDFLKQKADLVLWNEFPTKERFIEYARRQISTFLERENEWE